MLSFLNQLNSFTRTPNHHLNPLLLDSGRASLTFTRDASNPWFMTCVVPARLPSEMPPTTTASYPPQASSLLIPPPHWHAAQDETFRVVSGSMLALLSNIPRLLSPGETVHIPRGVRHTFSNGSASTPLVVEVQLTPDNRARDERFFRNAYGYLADCTRAGCAPSPLQALLFLHSADVVPALPGPEWLMRPLGRFVAWFGGVVLGKRVFGYREWYPEYTPKEVKGM